MPKQIYTHLQNAFAILKRKFRNKKLKKAANTLYSEYEANRELTAFSELEDFLFE